MGYSKLSEISVTRKLPTFERKKNKGVRKNQRNNSSLGWSNGRQMQLNWSKQFSEVFGTRNLITDLKWNLV
jgi:hypothetical protein